MRVGPKTRARLADVILFSILCRETLCRETKSHRRVREKFLNSLVEELEEIFHDLDNGRVDKSQRVLNALQSTGDVFLTCRESGHWLTDRHTDSTDSRVQLMNAL